MNQRIRELLEQAGYKPLPGFDFANSLDEVFMQKFAELIVRECIEQIDINNYNSGDDWDAALTRASNTIKEHFGVEE